MDISQVDGQILILVEENGNYSELDIAKYLLKSKEDCLVYNGNEQGGIITVQNDIKDNQISPNIENQGLDNLAQEETKLIYANGKIENGIMNDLSASFSEEGQVNCGNIKLVFSNVRIKNEPDEISQTLVSERDIEDIEGQIMTSCLEQVDAKRFACTLCSYRSDKARNLRTHHLRTHMTTKAFQCDYCEFKTKYRRNLRLHILKHTGEKPFLCDQCDYRTPSTSNLQRHKRVHLSHKLKKQTYDFNIKPFHCDQCDFVTHNKNNLRHHYQRHNGLKPYQCQYCEFCSSTNYSLKRHMLLHTRDNQFFQCPHCNFRTKNSIGFEYHQERHKDKNINSDIINFIKQEPIEEETCQETEYDERCQETEFDERCQETEFDERCQETEFDETCQETEFQETCQEAESEDCFYNHSEIRALDSDEIHIADIEGTMFKCNHCEFIGNLFDLKTHTISNHSDIKSFDIKSSTSEETNVTKKGSGKQFVCSKCDFIACSYDEFKLHRWAHIKNAAYPCDQCEYRTTKKYLLVIHQRQHTGERPFRCDQCDYGAVSRETLRRHRLKHNE